MENNMTIIIDHSFIALVAMLAVGILAEEIAKIIKIPDVVLYLLAGIIIGPEVLGIITLADTSLLNQIILVFGAAFLLYLGGREVDIDVLMKLKVTIISLSTIGVLLSTTIVGLFAHYALGLDLMTSLLIGAVIASTDPASLLPVFAKVPITEKIRQTVISESALNDAMGTVITLTVISIITSGSFQASTSIIMFVKMLGIGLGIGAIFGFSITFLFTEGRLNISSNVYPILTICAVIIAYTTADILGGSGYMATFIIGMICGNKRKLGMQIRKDSYITQKYFRETIQVFIVMSIFILLGTHVEFKILYHNLGISIVLAAVLIFVSRPICIFLCTSLDRKSKWTLNEKFFMSWVRETGVIPAAMSSIIVAMKIDNAQLISSVVFMTILCTLVLQGTTTGFLARKLKVLKTDEN